MKEERKLKSRKLKRNRTAIPFLGVGCMRPTPTTTCLAQHQRGPGADMLWRCEFCCRTGSGAGLRWSCPAMGAISGGVVDRHNRIVGNCRRGVCYSGCITGELCLMVCLLCMSEVSVVLQLPRKASAVSSEAHPKQNVKLARRSIAVGDRRGMELGGSEGYMIIFTCIISTQSHTVQISMCQS